MPGDTVSVVRSCAVCGTEIETLSVKKENLFLRARGTVDCPKCGKPQPEARDVAGRIASIVAEIKTHPKSYTR